MSSSASSSVATAATPEAVTPSPEAITETYVATWNETDPARRRAGIAAAWAEAGTYRDPVMASDGHAGVDAMLAGVQARFPGFVLKRTSRVDAHNGALRFTWRSAPRRARRSSRASISAPWRRMEGWPRWWGLSTRRLAERGARTEACKFSRFQL
jgi:hypothetical protein